MSEVPPTRVLVIDDDDTICRIIGRMLGRGYDVTAATSAAAAKDAIQANPRYDVILCDILMPRMTGTELHAWIAQHDPGLAERLVFVTGGALSPRLRDYLARAGNPRIYKPFELCDVERAIALAITRNSALTDGSA